MNWPAYPEYKESGVPWLGDVPRRWVVDRIKWSVASSQNGIWGNEPDGGPDDIRCVRVADFDRPILGVHDRDITNRKVSASERRGRLLRRGDLILEKSGGGEKSPVGFVVLYDRNEPAVTSNFVARVTLRQGMEPRFWTYLHHWLYVSRITQRSIKQTSGIQNLDQQSYLDERVCFPSANEQVLIANFLDRETAKIDGLIGKQEQLIGTLREDRAATITQAVTKGLDPSAALKESGSTWLGAIPIDWTTCQLGRLCRSVSDGPHFSPDYVDERDGVMFLSARNIRVDGWSLSDAKFISEEDYAEFSKRVVPEVGDVLYTKGGTTGVARAVDIEERFQVWVHVAVLKIRTKKVNPEFLAYALNSRPCYEQSQLYTRGATNKDLGLTRMIRILLALPPVPDQIQITEFLDDRCSKIDALIDKATEMIEVLREYRSALITNAVTGKIDVREAV